MKTQPQLSIEVSEAQLAADIAEAHRRHERRLEKIAKAEQFAAVPFSEQPEVKSRERYGAALALRRQGKTFREVGQVFNVTAGRAAQMCHYAERVERRTTQGLSTRATNVLLNEGLGTKDGDDIIISPETVSSRLTLRSLTKLPNCGHHTANEILFWLIGRGYQMRNG